MSVVLLLALVGCEQDPGEWVPGCRVWATKACFDRDGDGFEYTESEGRQADCDDGDAAVNPDASEVCGNGIDDDCDGLIDQDAIDEVPCYCDVDGDGYGMSNVVEIACGVCAERPASSLASGGECPRWSADASDCDDQDPNVHRKTWYRDDDGDGYGVDTDTEDSCVQPFGYAREPGDCDDANISGADGHGVNPSAPEICNDGIDNNCSGTDGDHWCGLQLEPGELDAPGEHLIGAGGAERFGHGVAVLGWPDHHQGRAEDAPDHVLAVGSRLSDSNALNNNGGVSLFAASELLGGAHGNFGELVGQDTDEYAGSAVATAGLFDDDLEPDLVVGAYNASPAGASAAGRAYVVLNPVTAAETGGVQADGSPRDLPLHTLGITLEGPEADAGFGGAVAGGSDVNGDGYSDVLIGASLADHPAGCSKNGGAAFLFLGGPGVAATPLLETRTDCVYVNSGDTCELQTDDQGDPGCALPPDREGLSGELLGFYGTDKSEHAGTGVGFLGDVDGDGLDDFGIGAPLHGADQSGAVYLVLGWQAGVDPPPSELLEDPALTLVGEGLKSAAGQVVTGIGDFDGDGLADFAVGAPDASNAAGDFQAGVVYLVLGGQLRCLLGTGTDCGPYADLIDAGPPWQLADFPRLEGLEQEYRLGESITSLGEVDGVPTLMIGSSEANTGLVGTQGDNGVALVVRGGEPIVGPAILQPSATLFGPSESAGFGWAVAGPLVWGDQRLAVIGAYIQTNEATSDGSAYLIPHGWLVACDAAGSTCLPGQP